MKSAATILLILQTFFVCPVLNAQTVGMAPAPVAPISAPLAVGAAMGQGASLTTGLGSQSLGVGQLGIAPTPSLAAPSLQLPASAAPAEAVRAANAILSAIPQSAPQSAPAATALSKAAPSAVSPAVQSAPAATVLSKGAPSAVSPSVARAVSPSVAQSASQSSKSDPASPLASLKAAQEHGQPGKISEAAVSALFDGAQKAEPKEWTFMVFLNGHNNLDRFGEVNIKQMEKVGSNDRVNIVVQWASLGKPTKRMLIQRSESGVVSSPVIEELPAVDMGSADRLYDFVKWSVEKFPAAHYMLDLWDHGAGWHIQHKKAFYPHDISWDDQTGNHITTEQLGDVMRKVKTLIGRPIDVLGFDACLMAMAEVMAQVADSVHYMAASEQTEPGAGWPYEKVLKQWLAAKADDGAALLKALAENYVAAYNRDVNFSGVDLTKFPAFAKAVKAYAQELGKADETQMAQVRKAAQATRRYAYSDYGDFLDFVTRLSAAGGVIVSAPVAAAVLSAFKDLVVANAASPDQKGSNGVSVWLPMGSYLWQQYGARYLKLVWNTLTDFGQFVRRLSGGKSPEPQA